VKLLFDHNLSPRLAKRLADLHPDSSHAFLLDLDQASDAALWQRARQDGYTIVTKDSDFADLSVLRGFPPKVIWIRIGNCTTAEVEKLLRSNHDSIAAFEQDQVVGLLSLL
jgi:predicted nuclease of predicted toxin-antitoxin system